MRVVLRRLGWGVLLSGILCALAAAAGYGYLRQSLPQASGLLRLQGLAGEVEVLRDAHGVPHIYAGSIEDANFALGFVHAQDRLWQMEMSRRIGAGRLAEALGAPALETDRFIRTLGVRRAAEAGMRNYDAETRRVLDAYAAGVNAFLDTRPVLPPEFWLTGLSPEPWAAADSVTWTKMMAWDLGGNWRRELLRMRLAKTLPTARIQEFLAPYPGDAPVPLPDLKELYRNLEKPARELAERWGSDPDFPVGSNNWVVGGERSASGKPLLANDPHLGLSAPPVWYFAHLHAPGIDVIGASLPGVPGIILGRNERIAWAFTNTGPDVQDLYLEKIDASGHYLTPEGARPFTVLTETIKVKGAADERLTVRVSRHGPVISDVLPQALEAVPRGHALAFAWTALAEDDLTAQFGLKVMRATDWTSFLEAARDFHAPQQNMLYADVAGNIGFIAAGRVPVRKPANDLKGLAPAPGWDARYDWAGFIPFTELPRSYNPASSEILTANHKIVPPGYAHYLTSEWEPPYRARRIAALLDAERTHSVASFARMQGDVVSLAARDLLPKFLAAKPKTEEARRALQALSAWDGTMAADRAEPLILVAWWRALARALYADELGDAFARNWSPRATFVANVLDDRDGQSRWCDDVRTKRVESCDEILSASLEEALADLRRRYGTDPARWKWGEAHPAHHAHRPFSRIPWLAAIFDISVPSAGDAYTINVGRSDFDNPAEPFASRHAPSLRAIYDLADPQASLFIHSGGQSGNPLSSHYRSFTAAWARGEYIPMITERQRLENAGVQRLVLVPRK
jgi:penicillin G amidase